ncbi:hypothetical protein [Azospirillum argentinense]
MSGLFLHTICAGPLCPTKFAGIVPPCDGLSQAAYKSF